MDGNENLSRASFLRQLDVFDPSTFRHACHVVGAGAVGSQVADKLVRFGVPRVDIYDDDKVLPHNVPTGLFAPNQIGMPKVDAISQRLSGFCDSEITTHREKVGDESKLSGVIFLCVDKMEIRRSIWQHCIKQHPEVQLMIEIRVGPQEGRVYTVEPLDLEQIRCWEEVSSYDIREEDQPACTNRMAVTTVTFSASLAVQQMVNWHSEKNFAHSIIFGLNGQPLISADRWV